MSRLDRDPQVVQLAKELGLGGTGGWTAKIQGFARAKVKAMIRDARVPVTSLDMLLQVLADQLSVKIEYVRSGTDLERLAVEYDFSEAEYRCLCIDLNDAGVDGLLIRNPNTRPGNREFLAVVDARGDHGSRAYFTGWHEVAHLIVTPPQRAFAGVFRSISTTRNKDPEESIVDAVAGDLAFYEPLMQPAINMLLDGFSRLTFDLVEDVRAQVASGVALAPSLYATAIAVVRLTHLPTLLVQIKAGLKVDEEKQISSGQVELALGSAVPAVAPKLRVTDVIWNQAARDAGLGIFQNMRVPERSVLTSVFRSAVDATVTRAEDQDWWETSSEGALPALPLQVEASRRGSYVYGLISPAA